MLPSSNESNNQEFRLLSFDLKNDIINFTKYEHPNKSMIELIELVQLLHYLDQKRDKI